MQTRPHLLPHLLLHVFLKVPRTFVCTRSGLLRRIEMSVTVNARFKGYPRTWFAFSFAIPESTKKQSVLDVGLPNKDAGAAPFSPMLCLVASAASSPFLMADARPLPTFLFT